MEVLLFIDLTASATYHQAVPAQVKKVLPKVATLDLDAHSGELLQHYALRLLHDADKAVVCVKATESVTDISALMPLLEELFLENSCRLVLLLGQHSRLQRMLRARPGIKFETVGEEDVLAEVEKFLYSS